MIDYGINACAGEQNRTEPTRRAAKDHVFLDLYSDNAMLGLKESAILENMLDGFALHEILLDSAGRPVDYRFLSINPAFEKLTGLRQADLIGRTVLEVLPETEKIWIERYGGVALTGEPISFESEAQSLGKKFEVRAFCPGPGKFACIFHDITEREENRKRIQRSESELQAIHDNAPMIMLVVDKDRRVRRINRAGQLMSGRSLQESCGRLAGDALRCVHAWDSADGCGAGPACVDCRVSKAVLDATHSGNSVHRVPALIELEQPDGSVTTHLRVSVRHLEGLDEALHLVCLEDVSDLLLADQQRSRLLAAIDQAAEVFLLVGVDRKVEYVNSVGEHVTGYSSDTVLGADLENLLDLDLIRDEFWGRLEKGEVWRSKMPNKKPDGDTYFAEVVATSIDDDGHSIGYAVLLRDITREHELERQLHHAEKMEAIGHLAGGVAHDFNNILAGILGFAELTKDRYLDDPYITRNLQQIMKGGERAKKLIQQILMFSRDTEPQQEPFTLFPVIEEVAELLRAALPATIEISLNLSSESSVIEGDPNRIHEMLMNLCTNAAHAVDKKGIVQISCTTERIESGKTGQWGEIESGDYAVLAVRDDGCGISQEKISQVFEPFYTTKQVGEGTGMGLAVVYGIVKTHGGNVIVTSERGRGTVFAVYLPLVKTPVESDQDTYDIQAPEVVGTERIMFIDDEDMLREVAADMLAANGYAVEAFDNAPAAWEALRTGVSRPDIIISDLTMPGMNGIELATLVHDAGLSIPLILCTGYLSKEDKALALKCGVSEICCKPCSCDELILAIRQALDKEKTV